MASRTESELADEYNTTEDLSGFDRSHAVPAKVKLTVAISVRFSGEEMTELRRRAERANVPVPSFSRSAALEASSPVDRTDLGELARDLEQRAHDVAEYVARDA